MAYMRDRTFAYTKAGMWVVLGIGLLLIYPILGVFFGAVSGWLVGLFFEETILGTVARTGMNIKGLSMWELGALLGFVGGFLKTSVSTRKD